MFERIPEGEHRKGTAKITLKDERGFILTKDFGFTIEEESGKLLAFDLIDHPELGTTLLFGDQVFSLRFWQNADLDKGLAMLTEAVRREKGRRNGSVE